MADDHEQIFHLNPDSFYTTKEVARYLRYSPRTVEGWRYMGIGPDFRRMGKRVVRYLGQDVLEWMHPPENGEQERT